MTQKTDRKQPSALLRIVLPLILVLAWLAVGGVGGPAMGKISEVATNDRALFLPAGAESTQVEDALAGFRESNAVPAIVVVESDSGALNPAQLKDVPQKAAELAGAKEFSPIIPSEDGQAAQFLVLIPEGADVADSTTSLRESLPSVLPNSTTGVVGGPAAFTADLTGAFAGIDGLLLIVSLAVVFVILVAVYRSPILPIVVLMSAMFALVGAVAINIELARAGLVLINGQIQGILFILVIGAATDYGLLYVARYREELGRHESAASATWAAIKGVLEPILASGGTVIVGLLCLLLSALASNSGLGPVAAIGLVMAMASALTFLPAMLVLLGRVAFWPRAPRPGQASADAAHADAAAATHGRRRAHTPAGDSGVWSRVSHGVQRSPRIIAATVTLLLAAGCLGLLGLKADGVPQSEFVLGESPARDAQAVLERHFPGGSGTPAYVLTPAAKQDEVLKDLSGVEGVSGLALSAKDSPSGTIPVGADARLVKQGPFARVAPTEVEGNVLIQATLSDAGDSLAAEKTVQRMRDTVGPAGAKVGGTTAIDYDTNVTSSRDRNLIIPIVLAAITVMLALLLRSLVAPLVLLATTVLSFGTALGLSALIFKALGFTGSDPTVPLYGFVFLVALGIDYNIFLMTRVREEALGHGTREGVHRGLVSTGGVITSAGVVLAATFAALLVIPIQFLVQLAIIVSLGVLLDALVVRSFLVPALTVLMGDRMWWPSRVGSPARRERAA